TWAFSVIEADLNSAADVAELEQRMNSVADKDRTALWLILRGTLPTAAKARLDEALDHFTDLFAPASLRARHTRHAVSPRAEDSADLGLSGYLQDTLDELSARATADDDTATTAQDALGLLYRFARSGS